MNSIQAITPDPLVAKRQRVATAMRWLLLAMTTVGLVALIILLVTLAGQGLPTLTRDFLQGVPSRFPEQAGIKPALYGSLWVIACTAVIAVPLGTAAAIYLEEYAEKNRLANFIDVNISNLAGVPSIVYGMLGLVVFVRGLGWGRSVISGAATLTLLVLPVIIIAAREAIRAVPPSIRQASYGIGATRWQTVRHHVLPSALPGILTGIILALSRAFGETAPLIMIGALTFVVTTPTGIGDPFAVLPIQIYNWASRPKPEFHAIAASGIIVLLVALLSMNALAILIRNAAERKKRW